ncbi:MAG: hypothetical protein U9Q40_03460 [Campylobacterota bacterium]|nr:hypothetical protein [Campylobacterota bacterium]
MCIPHGAMSSKDNGYIEEKQKKHVTRVSQAEFEKGDPDFVDERVSEYKPKKNESFLDTLIKELVG